MRVITGTQRGRNLVSLRGDDVTRPTSQNVKEALFSAIQFELENRNVLDLFAGTAQLGIEALSRGAAFCTFVEKNKDAFNIVSENIRRCSLQGSSKVVLGDAQSFLLKEGSYDIAFADPPYNSGLIDACMPLLIKHMSDDGIIVCETSKNEQLPQYYGDWTATKVKNYGRAKLTFYRKEKR